MEPVATDKPRQIPEWLRGLLFLGLVAVLVGLAGELCVGGGWAHILGGRRVLRRAQEQQARNDLRQILEALERYKADRGAYPAGDGSGSTALAAALATSGADGKPYLARGALPLTPDGHYANPLWGDPPRDRFYYGLVQGKPRLWAADRNGRPDGINNWER